MFHIINGRTLSEEDKERGLPHPFPSFREAKEAVDKRIAIAAKTKKTKEAFKVPALDGYGYHAAIRGINANTADLLYDAIDESIKRNKIHEVPHFSKFYPDVPAVRDMLLERTRLFDRIAALNAVLSKVEINMSRGYGRISIEQYDVKLDELKAEIADKTKKAESAAVPK
jgi:hypothetical protein